MSGPGLGAGPEYSDELAASAPPTPITADETSVSARLTATVGMLLRTVGSSLRDAGRSLIFRIPVPPTLFDRRGFRSAWASGSDLDGDRADLNPRRSNKVG